MSVEKRAAHLGLLRALTKRMAVGSLLLKTWVVVLVGGLLALAAKPFYARWAWLALFIAIAFWMMDAHLLRQRRLYQKVYDRARLARDASLNFLLATSAVEAWDSLMFSRRLALFYAGIIASIAFAHCVRNMMW